MGRMSGSNKGSCKENNGQVRRELAWLGALMKRNRGSIGLICLLGLAGTVMGLASSVASKYLIDAVAAPDLQRLWTAVAIMAALLLGSLVLQGVSSRVSVTVHIRVKNELQRELFGHILRASWQETERYQSGDLLHRLSGDIGTVADGAMGFVPGLLTSCVKLLGALLIMLYFDPVMALIALVGTPVTLVLSRMFLRKLRQHDLKLKALAGELMSCQEDALRNLTQIKAFGAAARFEQELEHRQEEHRDASLSYHSFRICTSAGMSLLSMAVTAACLGWGVYQLWAGKVTYGSLVLFLQLANMLRSAFSSLVSLMQQTVSVGASAGRIMELEELQPEDLQVPAGFPEERDLAVRLRNVRFAYEKGDTVLHPFDFDAAPGELVAVTGTSGEGKTTLLRLLLGLVRPSAGRVELVGREETCYTVNGGTRGAFSYVPQGNSMFSGTVAENLRMVKPDATDEELKKVLQISCAWDFVRELPGGLAYRLGSGGHGISEGQAQRLAIARALLRGAPILLLDEATAALDEATERQLLENLKDCGMVGTCILVTHRAASAAICSREYKIREGRVERIGK